MPTSRNWLLLACSVPFSLVLACGDKDGEEDDGDAVSAQNVCYDEDLGSSVEYDLATAESEGDDYQISSCDGEEIGTDGEDYGWTWTAPATGGYTFSTTGSDFDTIMTVHEVNCTGALLACNDDVDFDNDASQVYLTLSEGDKIVIVVDGYDAYESGDIELHVLQDL